MQQNVVVFNAVVLLVVLFVVLTTIHAKLTREECTLARDEFDLCGRELLVLGDSGQQFPETLEGVDNGHCRLVNESLNCVQSYSQNCIKSFSRNVLNSMLTEIKTSLSERCQQNKQLLVQNSKCLNQRSHDLNECVETFISDLETIRDSIQNRELLKPYSCCRFAHLQQCVSNIVQTCGQTAEQLMSDLLSPLKTAVCTNLDPLYKCANLEPLDRKTDFTERSLSALVPLIDILNALAPIDPCVSAREKVDDCATRLLVFGDREQRFASTLSQLEKHSCPLLNTSIECLHAFDVKCVVARVDTTVHSIIESLITGAKRELNDRCGSSSGGVVSVNDSTSVAHAGVFRVSTCLNRGLDAMHTCYDKYVAELESIRDQTEDKHLKTMYACCRFHAMQQCVLRNAKLTCERVQPDGVQYVSRVINNIARDFLVNTCSEFWSGSALCDALDPLDIDSDSDSDDKKSGQKKKTDSQTTYSSYAQSFVRPLIDMFIVSSENM